MENKPIKQIKTQCPFPLLIYKTHIRYNEVRKASGVAYILLELITKQRSDTGFKEELLKIGIPAELHYLFGNELAGLIKSEIVSSVYPASHFANPRYFGEIKLNEVTLTEKGKKLFQEGAIPTGVEKEKAKAIYFSPVTRKVDMQYNLTYSPLKDCFLGEEILDNVKIDISGLEDYLNANTTKVGLKAEERIVSFETEEAQKMNVRVEDNITLNIYSTGIEFTFATSDERAFFDKYYSSEIIRHGMIMKDKFKFPNIDEIPTVALSALKKLSALYLPNEFMKQAKRPCVLLLQRGNAEIDRDDVICIDKKLSCELLDKIDENAEFALLDKSGCKYYCAVDISMPCKNFGDMFTLPLLAECAAERDVTQSVIERIYEQYSNKEFNEEVGRVVIYAVDSLNHPDFFSDFIEKKICVYAKTDDKIETLLKLNAAFKKHSAWKPYFSEIAARLYEESTKEVTIENVIYKNTVLSPLKDALQISDQEYIKKFSENICKTEMKEIAYEALVSADFSDMDILSVANVIELFMAAVTENVIIVSETELASRYKTVKANLWKLNDMLGIDNFAEYTLKEDYNADEFFAAYSTLQSSMKSVDKYRGFAPKEYEILGRYLAIYSPIHELLSIERTSSSHPEKITKKYIDDYIAKGKWKDAICDLLIKLQYDLRGLLQADRETQANDLIDEACKAGFITRQQADAVHKLRMCRNGFQHPERKQIPFDKSIVESWRDIVFSIGGQK